jgi:hypothetical protein
MQCLNICRPCIIPAMASSSCRMHMMRTLAIAPCTRVAACLSLHSVMPKNCMGHGRAA